MLIVQDSDLDFFQKKIGEDGPQSPRGLTVRTGPEFLPRGGLSRSTLATIVLHSAHCAIGSSAPRRTDGRLGPVCCMELLHKFFEIIGAKDPNRRDFGAKE